MLNEMNDFLFQISSTGETIHKLNLISSVKSAEHETEAKKEKEKRSTPGAARGVRGWEGRGSRKAGARGVIVTRGRFDAPCTHRARQKGRAKGSFRGGGKEARALFSRPAWMLN